ncbi:hypothetical protein [Sinorhizobium meliloti]|uniref:hypothetical protein n=1 Tax=Rhizobium meliloti TaxID=382 RepID=UPI00238083D6|nr:hypothetical protein [Sinorhizobium meliloti]MDE4553416.1 hypothetical protein [Sinorhizobium meliloti]
MPDPVEKTAEQLALEVKAEFDKTMNQVKEIAEKALAEAAKGVGMTDDLKEKADESLLKMNSLTEQVAEIEQKLARGGGNKTTAEKSIGEQFVEDQGVKDWAQSSPSKGKADVRFKATITSATTDTAGAAGAARRNHPPAGHSCPAAAALDGA